MKILVAVDGSAHSEMTIKTLKALQLSPHTQVTVMTVVPEHTFLGAINLNVLRGTAGARERAHKAQEKKAAELLKKPVEAILSSGVTAESFVCWGRPAEQIIKQAHEMRADLVVVGAKGRGDSSRFPIGSVSQKVMKYASPSVLLVREGTTAVRRVLLATDGSKYSDAVVRFLLDLPLPRKARVILVTALQSHIAALVRMPTLDLETNQQLIAELQAAEELAARNLLDKAKKQFQKKGYVTESLILRGDPAEEILVAAETLHPDLVALGAKGLTGIEAFLLGSVAQRVAKFSRYSVLLGRAPGRHEPVESGSET